VTAVFILETKTKNKKTGKMYVKHALAESYSVDGVTRHRTIMQLGHLDLPKTEWKKLAYALECQISGQFGLSEYADPEIELLAFKLFWEQQVSKRLRSKAGPDAQKDASAYTSVDLSSTRVGLSRTLGAELVCEKAWDLLGFKEILQGVGLGEKELAVAHAIIIGKLVSPGSERHTREWFQKRSALPEFKGYADISKLGKDSFYEIGDKLFSHKKVLEDSLYKRERALFPTEGLTIFLYDLTNTYMEGACLGNSLAQFGHCKSKRTASHRQTYDCYGPRYSDAGECSIFARARVSIHCGKARGRGASI
jgi:hypothetical protein